MKKRTWLKLGSMFLALVMCVSTFGGLFITAEAATATTSDGAASADITVLGDVVPGEGAGSTVTVPTAPASGYDVWDGSTYDTEWESAGDNAYYIQSAAELAGLKKVVDDAAATNAAAWVTAAEEALTTDGANATDPGYGNYIHAYTGYTFYVTVNIDLNNYDWDGIGTHDNWSVFHGTIAGAANRTAGEMVYIKGLKVVYDSTDNLGTVTTSTISEKSFSVANTVQGVGFVTIQSGGGMKDLTFVNPTSTQAIQRSAIVIGRTRTSTCTYDDVHVIGGTFTLTAAGDYNGCFLGGADGKAVIQNCSVTETAITYTGTVTPGAIGGLAGGVSADGKNSVFQNCLVDVDINYYGKDNANLGGILGYANGACSLINCSYVGTFTLAADCGPMMGGIIGRTNALGGTDVNSGLVVDSCTADFTFDSNGLKVKKFAGGIAGGSTSGYMKVTNCDVTVDITTGANVEFAGGGFAGYFSGSSVSLFENNIVTGTIEFDDTAATCYNFGGFIGSINGGAKTFNYCVSDVDFILNAATQTTAAYYQAGGFAGLVGSAGHKIENCAYVGSFTTVDKGGYGRIYQIGGFVGRADLPIALTNVQVDMTVNDFGTVTTKYNSDTIAGVIGYQNNTGVGTVIDGAQVDLKHNITRGYTGKVSAYGGVVGKSKNIAIKNCVVNYEIDASVLSGTTEGALYETGGIIGAVDSTSTLATIDNCFVQGKILGVKRGGGVIGGLYAAATITNTQSEMIVSGTQTQVGAFIGRAQTSFTMQNCVLTGVACNTYNYYRAFSWVGLMASNIVTASTSFTIENCYSNGNLPVLASCDAATTTFTGINLNGSLVPVVTHTCDLLDGSGTTTVTDTTSFMSAYVAGDLNEASLDSAVWTTYTDGTNPVLKIADSVYRPYAKADLRWFNPTNGDTSWGVRDSDTAANADYYSNILATNYTIDTQAEGQGWAMMSWLHLFNTKFEEWVSHSLARDCYVADPSVANLAGMTDGGYTEGKTVTVEGVCCHDHVNDVCTDGVVKASSLNLYKQLTKAVEVGGYEDEDTLEWVPGINYSSLRLIATIKDLPGFYGVGFEITNAAGQTYIYEGNTVYQQIQTTTGFVGTETVGEPDGYFFALDITNVPIDTAGDITVRAFVRYGDVDDGYVNEGIAYGEAETFNVKTLYNSLTW